MIPISIFVLLAILFSLNAVYLFHSVITRDDEIFSVPLFGINVVALFILVLSTITRLN